MANPPSKHALELHRKACEAGEPGYTDPDAGLFVLTSFYLRERGYCCGNGCRHCPFSEDEQIEAGRPDSKAWPWPSPDSEVLDFQESESVNPQASSTALREASLRIADAHSDAFEKLSK